ncbi:hypothetical protein GCM10010124_15010 [Pilimelia terevasa]|uniref:CBU-0592-like domain-containing protein n=1 Tax=Pilimelia terevasa TaxID=53372 RepID=A0A8J3FJG1_9ACTN|nr:hypothetical protein [Pilimelia terevasa]GGK23524.1 hypothetical protein GCM10010124_15010 [Pilimelia terevasa]
MTVVDVVEVIGAVLVLAAFAAAQRGLLGVRSRVYLALNVVGAGILALIAWAHGSWGFLLLEGTWTVVSAISLVGVLRARGPGGAG